MQQVLLPRLLSCRVLPIHFQIIIIIIIIIIVNNR